MDSESTKEMYEFMASVVSRGREFQIANKNVRPNAIFVGYKQLKMFQKLASLGDSADVMYRIVNKKFHDMYIISFSNHFDFACIAFMEKEQIALMLKKQKESGE